MMLPPLLLLAALVCPGLSDDTYIPYGDMLTLRLHRRAQSLEFIPAHASGVRLLWRRYQASPTTADDRHRVSGSFYEVHNLTPKDSGLYTMRDKNDNALSSQTVEVIANTESHTRSPGEELVFSFDLDSNSCNIYFTPDGHREWEKGDPVVVQRGVLREDAVEGSCGRFELVGPCGILIEDLHQSCSGSFEVKDEAGNTALVVLLEMKALRFNSSYLGTGAAVFFALCCCHCVRRCCCGKSGSKQGGPDNDDAAAAPAASPAASARPAARYQEYDHEPVRPRPDQASRPFGARSPARPSSTATGALVSAAAEQPDAPTVPLKSEVEPRFEFKGMTFPSALGADSTSCDVYTSDKLNFL